MTAFERIKAIVIRHFGVADSVVTPATRFFEHLDCDDLDRLDVVMQVEATFHLVFTDDEITQCVTLGDLAELVEEKSAGVPRQAAE